MWYNHYVLIYQKLWIVVFQNEHLILIICTQCAILLKPNSGLNTWRVFFFSSHNHETETVLQHYSTIIRAKLSNITYSLFPMAKTWRQLWLSSSEKTKKRAGLHRTYKNFELSRVTSVTRSLNSCWHSHECHYSR